jgi:hypothetical protein
MQAKIPHENNRKVKSKRLAVSGSRNNVTKKSHISYYY